MLKTGIGLLSQKTFSNTPFPSTAGLGSEEVDLFEREGRVVLCKEGLGKDGGGSGGRESDEELCVWVAIDVKQTLVRGKGWGKPAEDWEKRSPCLVDSVCSTEVSVLAVAVTVGCSAGWVRWVDLKRGHSEEKCLPTRHRKQRP